MENMIVNTMEVLNVHPIDDLVSMATIKVCYVSDKPNRNNTIINEEIGRQIAATLPGAPVVGLFNREDNDFEEHSRSFFLQDGEFIVEDMTRPYGFVSPLEKPWFQSFEEEGEVRKYIMCTAYFWTRQYEEASLVMNKGQSMELDGANSQGYYLNDAFIFTSATLDKLCILGDKYEPCFSGAKIVSTFSKDYVDLAKELESIVERGFYVMNEQLIAKEEILEVLENASEEKKENFTTTDTVSEEKEISVEEISEALDFRDNCEEKCNEQESLIEAPKEFSLNYAVEIGVALTQAVYEQLKKRGATERYQIKGVYTENDTTFAIFVDVSDLEVVQCEVIFTAQDTVELASEMVAVKEAWSIKTQPEPDRVKPMPGAPTGSMVVSDTLPIEDSSTEYSKELEAQLEDKTKLLAEYTSKIQAMEEELGNYELKNKEREEKDKEILIVEYKSLMPEEIVNDIVKEIKDCSLEELETKMALAYARLQKKEQATKLNFQLDIKEPSNIDNQLPNFIRSAMAIDNQI